MSELRIVETADGSKTIWNAAVGEHYHSKHGAYQESRHVFLQSGLVFFLEKNPAEEVSVLEVGFGTGLNFLLSADYCYSNSIKLDYTGIEAHPLPPSMISETGYENYIRKDLWEAFLKSYPDSINHPAALSSQCTLELSHTLLQDFSTQKQFDVLYFDAFAAIHQPEMWESAALEACTRHLKPGGIFVTYAITGNLKRSMKALGFTIEKAKGAPGKREMLRAVKI